MPGPRAIASFEKPMVPAAIPADENASNVAAPLDSAPLINKKKQKRREKAAAKSGDLPPTASGHPQVPPPPIPVASDGTPAVRPEPCHHRVLNGSLAVGEHDEANNLDANGTAKPKKLRKKKKKAGASEAGPDLRTLMPTPANLVEKHGHVGDRIWSTSCQEERERIKDFWLGLGEEDRKSLVKVEKDAVLKKMKEQQKHTCSCSVCGRKRNAIEEELEGLYDAYYKELESFARYGDGTPTTPRLARDLSYRSPKAMAAKIPNTQPSRGRIVELVDDEELEESEENEIEDYSDAGADDGYSDLDVQDASQQAQDRDVADFLTFGNSLQVKGGILTVADDLLKNDGKRFIEMMEQLAERRMAREEVRDHMSRNYAPINHGCCPPPPPPHDFVRPDDVEFREVDEEEEEEFEESQEDEFDDEEEGMTDEQRMEEGRRMFQIFAARMFEQRVLSAYKEKVAKERQDKLLQELEDEQRQVDDQKAKKAKSTQKKKDKAQQKKLEEKARRDAEKAEEEASRAREEELKAAENRLKAEETRLKAEEKRKVRDEQRIREQDERQRQRDKKAEQERKAHEAREIKEKEKLLKEEQRLKDRQKEEQHRQDREAVERSERLERERRHNNLQERRQQEAQAAAERETTKKVRQQEKVAHKAAALAVVAVPVQARKHATTTPAGLPSQGSSNPGTAFSSPKGSIATPALPKLPTPLRPRQPSQPSHQAQMLGSDWGSASAGSSTNTSTAAPSMAGLIGHNNTSPHLMPVPASPGPIARPFRKSSTGSTLANTASQSVSPSIPLASFHPAAMHISPMAPPPGFQRTNHTHESVFLPPSAPPGMDGLRAGSGAMAMSSSIMVPPSGGRSIPMHPPPGFAQTPPGYSQTPPGFSQPPLGFSQAPPDHFSAKGLAMGSAPPSHARQSSSGFDASPSLASAQPIGSVASSQPIGRPTPIRRPRSVVQGGLRQHEHEDVAANQHLGSRALLDGSDDSITVGSDMRQLHTHTQAPGPRKAFLHQTQHPLPLAHSHPNSQQPPSASAYLDMGPSMTKTNSPWAPVQAVNSYQSTAPPGFGWAQHSGAAGATQVRPAAHHSASRAVTLRLTLCLACHKLSTRGSVTPDGYVGMDAVMAFINDPKVTEIELLDICDTEGNLVNGGGSFDVRRDAAGPGEHSIRWRHDQPSSAPFQFGAPGESVIHSNCQIGIGTVGQGAA